MLTIKSITMKNFLSVGNVTQAINLSDKGLTLVLGQNIDLGTDGSRNGVGKSTIIQALCYGLYGTPLTNIKKDNLINKTNEKNMFVTVEFSKNDINYKIERGRKPNTIRFLVNDKQFNTDEEGDDEAHGDMRVTQLHINSILGLSREMFKHIFALNTVTEPFLALGAHPQRQIIEELLGVTQLSEKGEKLKELNRTTKESITSEEFRIKSMQEANSTIQSNINNLKTRASGWKVKHKKDINDVINALDQLSHVSIDDEISIHKALIVVKELTTEKDTIQSNINNLKNRSNSWGLKHEKDINDVINTLDQLSHVSIDDEISIHKSLIVAEGLRTEKDTIDIKLKTENKNKTRIEKQISSYKTQISGIDRQIETTNEQLKKAEEHGCPTCGQELHDEKHEEIVNSIKNTLDDLTQQITELNNDINELETSLLEIVKTIDGINANIEAVEKSIEEMGEISTPFYSDIEEAYNHRGSFESLQREKERIESEINPFDEQIEHFNVNFESVEKSIEEMGEISTPFYSDIEEAYNHRSSLEELKREKDRIEGEINPFDEQIEQLTENGLQEVSYDQLNSLTTQREHQEFLIKLLLNKDSFIRKKIIEQNLAYLNHRLNSYLDKLGLPHEVIFRNDLSVEITELGRDFDFDNLSRGERNRLILGLSFSFRDVWESLNMSCNLMFIDELIDSGMDPVGVENSLSVLKSMGRDQGKDVFLISHKEELLSRVSRVMLVKKEGGFTNFVEDVEDIEEVEIDLD